MAEEGQLPVGGELPQNPLNNPPESRPRITAGDAIRAQNEREQLYSNLMDEMEKSVRVNGQYFIRLGAEKGARYTTSKGGKTDTRALLLMKSVVDRDGRNLFIAITREGPKGFRFLPLTEDLKRDYGDGEEKLKNSIKAALDPEETRGLYFSLVTGDFREDGSLYIQYNHSSGGLEDYSLKLPGSRNLESMSVDPEIVKTAIEESQKAAEIPHYLKLQEEQGRIADANKLSDVIKQLPPKQ